MKPMTNKTTKMKTKYTPQAAIRRRHAAKRLAANAKCVEDNFGIKYRITSSRRVIAIYSDILGQWESPNIAHNAGLTRMKLHSPFRFLPPTVFVQPAYDLRPEQPSFE